MGTSVVVPIAQHPAGVYLLKFLDSAVRSYAVRVTWPGK